jgi:hypothetical protein
MGNIVIKSLHDKRSRAGRLGGITTMLRHRQKYPEWGKLGGRPRALTLQDILNSRSQPLSNAENNEPRRMDTHLVRTDSLAELRRLWRNKQKSTAVCQIRVAETVSGSQP